MTSFMLGQLGPCALLAALFLGRTLETDDVLRRRRLEPIMLALITASVFLFVGLLLVYAINGQRPDDPAPLWWIPLCVLPVVSTLCLEVARRSRTTVALDYGVFLLATLVVTILVGLFIVYADTAPLSVNPPLALRPALLGLALSLLQLVPLFLSLLSLRVVAALPDKAANA